MEVINLHFGAGALGLGLVVPTFAEKVARRVVCNRTSPDGLAKIDSISKHRGYRLELLSESGVRAKSVSGVTAISYEQLPKYCENALLKADAILLTTALKLKGLEASLDELAAVCAFAQKKQIPLILLAAENQVDSKWVADAISKKIEKTDGIFYIKCVVDRICNKPALIKNGNNRDFLSVFAEDFAEIYVDEADIESLPAWVAKFLIGKEKVKQIIRPTKNFEYIVNRKKWIVNSSHLLLALYAHWNRYPTINSFTEDYPAIVDRLVGDVMRSSMIALQSGGASPAWEDIRFSMTLRKRLGKFPQVPYDAVTRFGGPESLFEFFKDFHRKVVEPHMLSFPAESRANRFPVLPFHITMCMIDLISKERWIVRSI
jgi:mannitol-1-phosphate/altronate dehydrogenase